VAEEKSSLLRGTLDLLVLKALALEELHGMAVAKRVEDITKGTFVVAPGSLFPALHRLERDGWLVSRWGRSETNRKAKYYQLTRAGRKQLERETGEWQRVAFAMTAALKSP
jgi:PadR family transcriptional regulator PadR